MIESLRARISAAAWSAGRRTVALALSHVPRAGALWRVFNLAQHEGPAGVARRIIRIVRGPRFVATVRAEVARAAARRAPVIFAPSIEWEMTLMQRPQQLARALAAAGRPCLYVARHQAAGWIGFSTVERDLHVVERLDDCLAGAPGAILWVFSTAPESVDLAAVRAAAGHALVVYDFIDEMDPRVFAVSDAIMERHRALLVEADLVVVTADRLAEQVTGRRGPVLALPNGGDLAHFRGARDATPPPELSRACAAGPLIGYYGALARWFDFALVAQVARARPSWQWVLIGPDYDRSLDHGPLAGLANVHVLGPRRYSELPRYSAWFDVATIPFVVDDVTEATSPVKLFEYMAARKPIVTTDLRECRKYRSVRIARDLESFIAQVEQALATRGDPELLALLDAEAESNGWPARAAAFESAIAPLEHARLTQVVTRVRQLR